MISFVLLILYSFSLAYLVVWVNRAAWKCSSCADADLPPTTPCPSGLSLLILLPMPLHFLALTFWGFTENPYRGQGRPWIRPGDDLAMLVIFLIGFCLAAVGYFLYKLGKLLGTLEWRRREIDEERRQEERDGFIRLHDSKS